MPNKFGQMRNAKMDEREFHPPHIYADNACYFLTGSIIHGQRLLDTDAKRVLVRDVLKEAIQQYGITLYAWVILANHYHLLLKTSERAPIYRFVKRLHGDSAIRLNKLDGTSERQVWYQYWDRFPRNDEDFWGYFNYIHINPIKHRYVRMTDGILLVEGKQVQIASGRLPDVCRCLASYPHSSYHYYVREYSEDFIMDAWTQYPIPDYQGSDDF